MMIYLYEAFYKNGVNVSLEWGELVSYVWIGQAFYTLVFFRVMNKDIYEMIRSGQVAYEYVRPLNIYWMWFSKICAERLSAFLIRFLPVIVFAALIPQPYNLTMPASVGHFALFILTMIFGLFISTALGMLIYIFMFFTISCKGLFNIYGNIADFFSGMDLPIAFMPEVVQALCFILPFRLCMDLPIRLYVGNITITEGVQTTVLQIAWIMGLVTFGNYMMKRVGRRLVVQGG